MKKLVLGLLLLSGLAIQAEEAQAPQTSVEPVQQENKEEQEAKAKWVQEIKELLEKEKEALLEGAEERASLLKPLIEEINKLLESKPAHEMTKELWAQVLPLENELNNRGFSFGAASIRKFSNYSADKAGYLGLKCYFNIMSAIPATPEQNEARQEFEKMMLEGATKNDLEELANCIRSNGLIYSEKDKNCFDSFHDEIRMRS